MSDILEIGCHNASPFFTTQDTWNWKEKIKEKMVNYFGLKGLTAYSQNHSFFLLLDSQHFCHAHHIGVDIFGLVEIDLQPTYINIRLSFLDSNSNEIKAVSTHQKTALTRLCNTLSSQMETMTIICNPVNGKIKMAFNYFTIQVKSVIDLIQQVFAVLESLKNIIDSILEFLELVPQSESKFMATVAEKMERCRQFLLGTHQSDFGSTQEMWHQQFFIMEAPNFQIRHCWLWETENRIFLTSILQKLNASLKSVPTAKKSNCIHVQLLQQEKKIVTRLQGLTEIPKGYRTKPDVQVQNLQLTNKESMMIEFHLKMGSSSKDEIQKIQRMSKHTYYRFLREYVIFRNFDMVNSYFLAYKYDQSEPLDLYLKKYKTSLSFLSRLNLCQQIVGIGCIGMSMKKFAPNYSINNLIVTSNMEVKLHSINHDKHTIASLQIAESCYQILYGSHHSYTVSQKDQQIIRKKCMVKVIDDGQSKYQGLSVINFWVNKILLDIMSSNSNNRGSDKRQIHKIQMDEFNCYRLGTEESSQESVQELPHNQLNVLEKLLFVIAMACKTYGQLFRDSLEIFDHVVEM